MRSRSTTKIRGAPVRSTSAAPGRKSRSGPAGPVASVLGLQRSAGNQSVLRLSALVRDARGASDEARHGVPAPSAVSEAASVLEGLGDGKALSPAVRRSMEARFGHDFGGVEIHTDAKAAELAKAQNARAVTVGSHIAFAAGEYRPTSPEGTRLLAHELAHTIQQRNATRPGIEERSDPTQQLEARAEGAAAHTLAPGLETAGALSGLGTSGLALQSDKKGKKPPDWDFTRKDYAQLKKRGKKLKMAADSSWVPKKMSQNIIGTLEYLLDPKRKPTPTGGVNIKDLYHGHLALPKGTKEPKALAKARSDFSSTEEKVEKSTLGTGSAGFAKDPTAQTLPAYTKAMKKTVLPKLGKVFEEAVKVKGALVIYHTYEGSGPSMPAGSPRRNWKTPMSTAVPKPYSPPEINNASSWFQDFDNVVQFSFLVDTNGEIHVRPGSTTQLQTVTGIP